MSPMKLEVFKRRAESARVVWELADGNAWEVDDKISWNRAYIALIIKDRTQAEYEAALQDFKLADKIKYTAHND